MFAGLPVFAAAGLRSDPALIFTRGLLLSHKAKQ